MHDVVDRGVVDGEILRLRQRDFRGLNFSRPLEEQFERDTAKERSHRLWLEGLIAIVVLNVCLLTDYLLVHDVLWESVVRRTLIVTPLALLINSLMLMNPRRWIREGSIAAGTALICLLNLYAEGSATSATASFGLMCVLITVLFANVVMRLRFRYAAACTMVMLAAGLAFAWTADGLVGSEKTMAASMTTLGVAITLTAGYSLERQERLSYLLSLSGALKSAELFRLSNLDRLTELPNRRAFEEKFDRLWAEGMRSRTPLSAIVIDIDHFKVVNDVYGHLYGDEVLRRVAGLLPQALRGQEDIAARFGGEEFVILLPDAASETAMVVAERVRKLVEMAGTPVPEQLSGSQMLWVTVSCGVSMCMPEGGLTRDLLLKSADRAMYKAKGNGRNRVEYRSCEAVSSANVKVSGRSISAIRMLKKLGVNTESGSHTAAKG